jgi:uncharacterized membrane protein
VPHFTYPLPWWLALVLALGIAGLVVLEYRRPVVPLASWQRALLAGCRALVLTLILLFLFRPFVLAPPRSGAVVPVLVDASRSMRIAGKDGRTRLADARAIVKDQLLPSLSGAFGPQFFSLSDALASADIERLDTGGRGTDLGGALAAVRDRYRGQVVAGVVLLSDGGDTTARLDDSTLGGVPPVFTVGIGSPDPFPDREVAGVAAGEQKLDQASVDLRVSVASTRYGREPFPLRVSANGRQIEERRVMPVADGATMDEVFTVSPDPSTPTVYRVEVPVRDGEPVAENNVRSVLVSPTGRKRRILALAGAPGFEHTFMIRALASDPGLEVDAVVRKGRNADGRDTHFIQAAPDRAAALTGGFPSRREDLYAYDALVIDNMESESFTRDALGAIADFVSQRGGGLLVVGGRSLSGRGVAGTPVESVLPVQPSDRRTVPEPTPVRTSSSPDKVVLTSAGETHPALRIGASAQETRRMWSALPPLAATTPVGGPRPGATILAVAASQTGAVYPVIAVQQYGKGRSMTFSGEASWRWRMLLPSTDRSYEFVWRQAARWLATPAPDPFSVTVPDHVDPGGTATIHIEARDAAFVGIADAVVDARVQAPDGETSALKVRREGGEAGRSTADFVVEQEGLYRISAEAKRGASAIGSSVRWMYGGGSDSEFADPRLNEAVLRRIARTTGGRYVRPADAGQIAGWLRETAHLDGAPERRDLWHEPWAYLLVIGALLAEWIARRLVGLR